MVCTSEAAIYYLHVQHVGTLYMVCIIEATLYYFNVQHYIM